jgi:hypothetical protein
MASGRVPKTDRTLIKTYSSQLQYTRTLAHKFLGNS